MDCVAPGLGTIRGHALRIVEVVVRAEPLDGVDDSHIMPVDAGGQEREDAIASGGGVATEVGRRFAIGRSGETGFVGLLYNR